MVVLVLNQMALFSMKPELVEEQHQIQIGSPPLVKLYMEVSQLREDTHNLQQLFKHQQKDSE
jgi:hypothetical protein